MRRPYRKLNLDERRILATMLHAKITKTKISETLGRDRSTIHREIKRNWWHDDEVPQADGYWHVTAQMKANHAIDWSSIVNGNSGILSPCPEFPDRM
jgi:IS30 family transposase